MKKAFLSAAGCLLLLGLLAAQAFADSSPLGGATGNLNVPLPNLPGSHALPGPGTGALGSSGAATVPAAATKGGTVNGTGSTTGISKTSCPNPAPGFFTTWVQTGVDLAISGNESTTGASSGFAEINCHGNATVCFFFGCFGPFPVSYVQTFAPLTCVEIASTGKSDNAYANGKVSFGPQAGKVMLIKIEDETKTPTDLAGVEFAASASGPFCGAHKVVTEPITSGDYIVTETH
jgi:hypothetical protein